MLNPKLCGFYHPEFQKSRIGRCMMLNPKLYGKFIPRIFFGDFGWPPFQKPIEEWEKVRSGPRFVAVNGIGIDLLRWWYSSITTTRHCPLVVGRNDNGSLHTSKSILWKKSNQTWWMIHFSTFFSFKPGFTSDLPDYFGSPLIPKSHLFAGTCGTWLDEWWPSPALSPGWTAIDS